VTWGGIFLLHYIDYFGYSMVIFQTPILSVSWNWAKTSLWWWWWWVVVFKHILVFSLGFDQDEQ
jgi:hypothetical protein